MDTIILHIALALCQFNGNNVSTYKPERIMILGDPSDYNENVVVLIEYDSLGNLVKVYHGTRNQNEKKSQNREQ